MQTEILTYPEYHPEWLDVMGITRWQSKLIASQSDAQVDTPETTPVELPECIKTARYWVLGAQGLTAEESYLLAGMMAAIHAKNTEVVYSHKAEQVNTIEQNTGLPSFERLQVQTVSDLAVSIPEQLKVLLLGDVVLPNAHAHVWRIPSLGAILDTPLLKREAWQALKTMWAHEISIKK
ncbi:hypothetical protein [Hydromonas duriensis]|uniref:DNA polymerase n=1 Tax=Hydromonas duriensis TaxID=1527608 RepID=A0A4V3DK31_9BURK|nr:hypothetical protein [Hydromonas duriensis]TDR32209.1 hypothetical protein DFR44_10596 [Hydromonas duriensis]